MPILLFFSFMKAAILLNLASLRFKQQAVVKANKFGQVRSLSTHHLCVLELMTRVAIQSWCGKQLNQNLRNLRAKAAAVLKDVSAELGTIGAEESTSEQRRAFADGACKSLQHFDEVRSAYSFIVI